MFDSNGFGMVIILILPIIIGIIVEIICKNGFLSVLVWGISIIISLNVYAYGFGSVIDDSNKVDYIYKNKILVYSLEDNLVTEGSLHGGFILGFGRINGQTDTNLCYFLMAGDKENGYSVTQYNASEVKVFPEDNIEQAYYIEKYKQNSGIRYFRWNIIKPEEYYNEELISKELHLPKGYIKQNYNIDMK